MRPTLFVGPGETAQLLALCPHPTEALCERELQEIPGVSAITVRHGAIRFRGTREALYRANLQLRTPSRILCPLSDWPCRGERDLYDQARELPWEAYLSPRGTVAVSAHGQLPGLENGMFTAQRIKDAICDQFVARCGRRPSVDVEEPMVGLNLHIHADRAVLSLDSSGESLHKRGYRPILTKAPLNEALAAAIVKLTKWDEKTPFIDPMCGSGTLPIEAAWIARQIGGPVRLQWMRHEGIAWDPKGPATIINIRGGLDAAGKVTAFDYFWKGVSGIAESHGGVTITFHARTDPRLVAVANREVACLLYPSTK